MLKRVVNECRFRLKIEPKGPLLIKDGRLATDESGKDWKDRFIKEGIISEAEKKDYPTAVFAFLNPINDLKNAIINKHYSGLKFYIPGTSLRGVMRSHAEKIVRTLCDDKEYPICCDPLDNKVDSSKISCSKKQIPTKDAYRLSCVICRLFGNTHSASRIHIYDSSFVMCKEGLTVRDGIAIDRFTGGVSQGANFKNHYLEDTFESEIVIRNFEIWQLGLMAYVLRDLEHELIAIGSGKNKGFGRIKGTVDQVELTYLCNTDSLKGIGEICPDMAGTYDFISILPDPPVSLGDPTSKDLYRRQFRIPMPDDNGGIVKSEFWKACAKVWNDAVEEFKTIPELN